MCIGVQVGHRVGDQRDVIAVFVRGPGGRLHPGTGGDPAQHDLRDAAPAQLDVEIGAVEGAPVSLGHNNVLGMPGQIGNDRVPSLGVGTGPARDVGAAGQRVRSVGGEADPYQHHGGVVRAESVGKLDAARHYVGNADGDGGQAEEAVLQVDQYERGALVEAGQ